ncbi:diacylglycerol kinase family protein [Idiomarina sp.]|uniref:diacylglycerol/lipid kinase family protein n=1 Tax=Idiomarina sp. TaxID=1874361 RepID=UPI0025C4D32E|nr:diacylglycerol kinase family protein [Idiomarina sp.]
MTILLIEHGASRRARHWQPRYQNWLQQQGHDVLTLKTQADETIDILNLHRLLERANEVILLAGDGTAHWLVNQLTEEQAQRLLISVIPCGTGNDFARDIGLYSADWRMQPEELLSQRQLDIAEINGIRFLNAASDGLPVDLIRQQSAGMKRWLGKFSYLTGVLGWWLRYRYTGQSTPVLSSVLVGRYLGGGIQLAPTAKRRDGQLTQVVVAAASKRKLLGVLWSVLRGKHMRHPLVKVTRDNEFTFTASALEIDGELYPLPNAGKATTLKSFIKVRVPSKEIQP